MISIRAVLLTFLRGLFISYPKISTVGKDQKTMNQFIIINTNKAPAAIGAYSQGLEVNGTYYFSGQIGIDPATKELKSSFDDQLFQILKNIDALLAASGLDRSNIVKTTIFLTDLNNFGAVNAAYTSFFNEPFPARSCVETSKLPKNALIEIEVIAHK